MVTRGGSSGPPFFIAINSTMETPCVKICTLVNKVTHMECVGCGRTQDEIRDWTILTDQERKEIMERLNGQHRYVIEATN